MTNKASRAEPAQRKAARPLRGWRRRQEARAAALFLAPGFLGLVVFLVVPLLASLALSFTNWQIMGTTRLVGLANFAFALNGDPVFWQVVGNTALFTLEYLALNIVVSLSMAVAIGNLRWGKRLFRLIFFLPTFTPLVGSAIVWLLIFTPGGFLDWLVRMAGLPIPNLVTSPALAMQAVVVVSLWSGFGYNLLLFGAALEAIPQQYLDAAALDGANPTQRFWQIKLPLISPSLFFGVVLTTISSLQVFDQVYALTRGGPGAATQTLGYKIYRDGFISYHFGYASALAWLLFVAIAALTLLQFALQKRWVHYDA